MLPQTHPQDPLLRWCPSLPSQFDFPRPRTLLEPHRAPLVGHPVVQPQRSRYSLSPQTPSCDIALFITLVPTIA